MDVVHTGAVIGLRPRRVIAIRPRPLGARPLFAKPAPEPAIRGGPAAATLPEWVAAGPQRVAAVVVLAVALPESIAIARRVLFCGPARLETGIQWTRPERVAPLGPMTAGWVTLHVGLPFVGVPGVSGPDPGAQGVGATSIDTATFDTASIGTGSIGTATGSSGELRSPVVRTALMSLKLIESGTLSPPRRCATRPVPVAWRPAWQISLRAGGVQPAAVALSDTVVTERRAVCRRLTAAGVAVAAQWALSA